MSNWVQKSATFYQNLRGTWNMIFDAVVSDWFFEDANDAGAPKLYLNDLIMNPVTPLSTGAPGGGALSGDFKWHVTHLAGCLSVAQMQALGWAICDGTTAAAQGVPGLIVMTDPTPDLITDRRFVRAGLEIESGTLEADQFEDHTHASNAVTTVPGTSLVGPGVVNTPAATIMGANSGSFGAETRPINIKFVPMMYVL